MLMQKRFAPEPDLDQGPAHVQPDAPRHRCPRRRDVLAAGVFAFVKLNIEAYPNPAPVILEVTAQAAGLSSEEMEKYYTIPIEIGLYPVPGVMNVRSTSFYGLCFVRVTFKYGIDIYFAYQQAAIAYNRT